MTSESTGSRREVYARLAGDAGLTLAEILIAMAIIAIGLVALAAVLPISGASMQQGGQMSTATFLAEQRLEQLKAAQWTAATSSAAAVDCLGTSGTTAGTWSFTGGSAPSGFVPPASGCTPATFADESPAGTALPDPYSRYTRQVRIQPCDAGGADCGGITDAALRRVTVRVSYQGVNPGVSAATQAVEVTTLMAQR